MVIETVWPRQVGKGRIGSRWLGWGGIGKLGHGAGLTGAGRIGFQGPLFPARTAQRCGSPPHRCFRKLQLRRLTW